MARSKKKAVVASKDTVTFTKKELVEKVKKFLKANNACSGDWLNKVKVDFLGCKETAVKVEMMAPATCTLDMACKGVPSKEEALERVKELQNNGELDFDWDDEKDFEIKSIKVGK